MNSKNGPGLQCHPPPHDLCSAGNFEVHTSLKTVVACKYMVGLCIKPLEYVNLAIHTHLGTVLKGGHFLR